MKDFKLNSEFTLFVYFFDIYSTIVKRSNYLWNVKSFDMNNNEEARIKRKKAQETILFIFSYYLVESLKIKYNVELNII